MAPLTRGFLVAGALLLVWLALDLLLLLFAGILLAIFLRTLAAALTRYTGLPVGVSLAVVSVTLVGVLVVGGWLYAPQLAEQSDQLAETLPRVAADMTSWLRQYSWGAWVLDQFSEQVEDADMAGQATTAARSVINAVIAVIIVLFVGLYLAAQPAPYVRGLLSLVPPPRRVRVAETLFAIGHVLRWWLVGQVLAMTLVGLVHNQPCRRGWCVPGRGRPATPPAARRVTQSRLSILQRIVRRHPGAATRVRLWGCRRSANEVLPQTAPFSEQLTPCSTV